MPTLATGAFETYDPRFADVLGPRPELLELVDADAHEGPVYAPDEHALYYTTLPQPRPYVTIERLDLSSLEITLVRDDAGAANGMALGLDGALVVCEQGDHARPARIARIDRRTGQESTLADSWGGLPLNSPNDVAVRSDGSIWFTDPSYGHLQGFRPPPQVSDHVYRLDPASGRAYAVADGFDKPNGLCFSPDERTLYVGDSGEPRQVLAFPVHGGCLLGEGRVFADISPGYPDGLKTDGAGRVYSSSASGVQVFDPGGTLLGQIVLPGAVNFTFGGPGRNVLYVTTDDAIWAATLAATGPAPPRGA